MTQIPSAITIPSHLPHLESLDLKMFGLEHDPKSHAAIDLRIIYEDWSQHYCGSPTPIIDTTGIAPSIQQAIFKRAASFSDSLSLKTNEVEYQVFASSDESATLRWRTPGDQGHWSYAPWPFYLVPRNGLNTRLYYDHDQNKMQFRLDRGLGKQGTDHLLFRYSSADDPHSSNCRDELLEQLLEDCDVIRRALIGATPLAYGKDAIAASLKGQYVFPFYVQIGNDSPHAAPGEYNEFLRSIDQWIRAKMPECNIVHIGSFGRHIKSDGTVSRFEIEMIKTFSTSRRDDEITQSLEALSSLMDTPEAPAPLHKQFGCYPDEGMANYESYTDRKTAPSSHEVLVGYERIQNILAAISP